MNTATMTQTTGSTRVATTILTSALAGVVLAWAMSRGPMTTAQSLAALGLELRQLAWPA